MADLAVVQWLLQLELIGVLVGAAGRLGQFGVAAEGRGHVGVRILLLP